MHVADVGNVSYWAGAAVTRVRYYYVAGDQSGGSELWPSSFDKKEVASASQPHALYRIPIVKSIEKTDAMR